MAVTELLRHVTVVSDPVRLAYLKAEAAKNKGKNEGGPARVRRRRGPSTLAVDVSLSRLTLQDIV